MAAGNPFVVLSLFPYTSGHLLIAANRHIGSVSYAHPAELYEMLHLARQCENAFQKEYNPDGYNKGFNLGRAAGAGVEHHLRMHILTRWVGDSNFVSVAGGTRVLSEALPTTY